MQKILASDGLILNFFFWGGAQGAEISLGVAPLRTAPATNHLFIENNIDHLDEHHLVFGINFQIHFVSLDSLVCIYFLILLSSHLCNHHHSQHPLPHSFTSGPKRTFSTNFSHLNKLLVPL